MEKQSKDFELSPIEIQRLRNKASKPWLGATIAYLNFRRLYAEKLKQKSKTKNRSS